MPQAASNLSASTNLTRRWLLSGVAKVAPVLLIAASPAIAQTTTQTECPEVLRLADRIEPTLAAAREALKRKDAACQAVEQAVPTPPELLPDRDDVLARHGCDVVRDFEGYERYFVNGRVQELITTEGLSSWSDLGRTKIGRRIRSLRRIAGKYEQDRADAVERFGVHDAIDALHSAVGDVGSLAWKISQAGPKTPHGAFILARAMSAHAEAATFARGHGFNSGLGRELVRAVLAGGAA